MKKAYFLQYTTIVLTIAFLFIYYFTKEKMFYTMSIVTPMILGGCLTTFSMREIKEKEKRVRLIVNLVIVIVIIALLAYLPIAQNW